MIARLIWDELYPDEAWPGLDPALRAIANEIRSLRLRHEIDGNEQRRSMEEIQRAHDLVVQYCLEMNDEQTIQYVSALCWVLRHDHIKAFGDMLATIEARLERLGIPVIRLPELVDPRKEN